MKASESCKIQELAGLAGWESSLSSLRKGRDGSGSYIDGCPVFYRFGDF
jgi:hypothetical protein